MCLGLDFSSPILGKEMDISLSIFTGSVPPCACWLAATYDVSSTDFSSPCSSGSEMGRKGLKYTDGINHTNSTTKGFSLLDTTSMSPLCCPNTWDYPAEAQRQRMERSQRCFHPPASFNQKSELLQWHGCLFSHLVAWNIFPQHQRWQEKSRVIQFAYFSSDEVPDMLSLEIGAMLQQHPKHPTKPKRTLLWTTGTKFLSIITAQGSKTPPRLLALCINQGNETPSPH